MAQNLPFQDAGLPLPQDTYRTGVLEILSEGSRFGLPSYRLAPLCVQGMASVQEFVNIPQSLNMVVNLGSIKLEYNRTLISYPTYWINRPSKWFDFLENSNSNLIELTPKR